LRTGKILCMTLPGLDHICNVFPVGRRQAETDTQVRNLRMRIMAPMELGDGLRVYVASLRFNQRAFLEVRFKNALQGDKEGGSIMAVPVGVAARCDLSVVDLNLDLRILGQPCTKLVKQNVTKKLLSRVGITRVSLRPSNLILVSIQFLVPPF
jgi:hypothetical protein